MKKKFSIIMIFIAIIIMSMSIFVNADDNADTGDGDTGDALDNKGFYRYSEYMYKVSVYVGKSDVADENTSLNDWKMIGSNPIYIKPASFTLPTNVLGSSGSKVDYLSGQSLQPINISQVLTDNPPPIPITNGGNINSVKSYFGDTNTLNALIDSIAFQQGTSRESLVSSISFTIQGETKQYPSEEIFPIKVNGQYQNKVPWLIIYEPVVITYLKDKATILAFTATEYALAQKLGYFNFKSGTDGQYVGGMTHSDLPNSIFLENSWFGYPVTSAYPDGVYWSDDRIISGGGWGMRMLRPNSIDVEENDTTYDYEYRVDTDVITSVRIYADEDITPDNRHVSQAAYASPVNNTATITLTANGYTKSTEVVIPGGGSELVWIKWHTPLTPGEVSIQVQVTGNPAAKIDGEFRSATISANVVDLDQNPPPNPTANDRNDSFETTSVPIKADKTIAEWGIYSSYWVPNWVWYPKWEWDSNWQLIPSYGWVNTITGPAWQLLGYYWEDRGNWVDRGKWVDEGHWEFDYTNYYAILSADMKLKPDDKVPTAVGNTMKSGYGVNIEISSSVFSNAPSSHITYVQNAITYFPEFQYDNFWRLLAMTSYGNFEFERNKYSTYNNPTHFTPIWYPDGNYEVYAEVIDMWTPDGMLRIYLTDNVTIDGNLYLDWHIGPK